MRMGTLFLAAIACAALAACTSTGTPRILLNCPGGTCPTINVTVNEIGTASNPACELALIPDFDLSADPSGLKKISWTIAAGNYEFSDDPWKYAIFIKKGSDPTGKFGPVTFPQGGKKLEIHFNHSQSATQNKYKYALTVRRSSGTKQFCKTLDPWLIS